MNRMLGWPLSLSLFKRDGYEPRLLRRARLERTFVACGLLAITLPTLLDRRKHAHTPAKKSAARVRDPEIAADVLRRTLKDSAAARKQPAGRRLLQLERIQVR